MKANPKLPITPKTQLELSVEDPRSEEEREQDLQREIAKRTYAMFGDMAGEVGGDGAQHAPSRIFEGHADRRVTVDGQPLPMTEQAARHSPDGFCWGYGGSGPSALAHALLAAVAGEAVADIWYQDFKRAIVTGWDIDQPWRMAETAVLDWLVAVGASADETDGDGADNPAEQL